MTKYFMPEENPHNAYYVKLVNYQDIPGFHHHGGSLILIQSGLLNMEYDEYLRMCRDIFHGELYGKNFVYPTVQFKNKCDAYALCDLLNPVMDMYVKYRESLND